jgi:hypothetical protein
MAAAAGAGDGCLAQAASAAANRIGIKRFMIAPAANRTRKKAPVQHGRAQSVGQHELKAAGDEADGQFR